VVSNINVKVQFWISIGNTICSNLAYFECSLIFGLFGISHVNSKIKHAKIKQTPKIKTPKSTIVYNCYEKP
jgi:cytoplasmic iron level regulating protein YaaA (DUF328/UPF0246 family)